MTTSPEVTLHRRPMQPPSSPPRGSRGRRAATGRCRALRPAGSVPRSGWRRYAATTSHAPEASFAWSRPPTRSSSTVRPTRWRAWPRSARFHQTGPCCTRGTCPRLSLRRSVAGGGDVVITDSNRRQAFVPGSLDQNVGPVLAPSQDVSADGLILDPIDRGPDYQTVASYSGVRLVEAPASPLVPQFPEHAPFAAIDGSAQTAWLADPTLTPDRRWLQVDFAKPRAVPYVDLIPYSDAGGSVREVEIAGHRFPVHPGVNRLNLGLKSASSLRVTLTDVSPPAPGATAGAGGIRELRIPGVRATEQLRAPVDAAAALLGANLDRVSLDYLFRRTTGDDPFARNPTSAPYSAGDVHDPGDAEQVMRRTFDVPARRSFTSSAWVSAFPQTPDDTLDRLAGYRGPVHATVLEQGPGPAAVARVRRARRRPGVRVDRRLRRGQRPPGSSGARRAPVRVTTLTLRPAAQPVRTPTLVRVTWPGGSTPALRVAAGGRVTLPRPVRAARFRIDVLRASAPAGATAADRRAVGIAEITVPGRASRHRAAATFKAPCGTVSFTRRRRHRADAGERLDGGVRPGHAASRYRLRDPGGAVIRDPAARGRAGAVRRRLLAPVVCRRRGRRWPPGPAATWSPSARPGAAPTTTCVCRSRTRRGSSSARATTAAGRRSATAARSGTPTPIDGYANGWHVRRRAADRCGLRSRPTALRGSRYLVSAIAGLLCLFALIGSHQWRVESRRTAARDEREPHVFPVRPAGAPWPVGAALGRGRDRRRRLRVRVRVRRRRGVDPGDRVRAVARRGRAAADDGRRGATRRRRSARLRAASRERGRGQSLRLRPRSSRRALPRRGGDRAAHWGAVADACCVPGAPTGRRLKDLRCLRAATSSPSTGTTTRGIDRRDPGRLTHAIPHGRTR